MNKHTSTHPVTGETATRNSKNRTYSHAVWVRETQARRVQIATDTVESNRAYVAKCERIVADWDAHVAAERAEAVARYRGSRWLSDEEKAAKVEESVHFRTVQVSPLSKWTDEYLPHARESVVKAEARLAQILDEGDTAEWGVVTWCGRHDLAVKQAASWAKKGYETLIVEAVVNAPKAAKVVEPEPQPEPVEAVTPEPVDTVDEVLVTLPGSLALGVASGWDHEAAATWTRVRIEGASVAALLTLRDAIDAALS